MISILHMKISDTLWIYIYMIENENMNWRENEFEHEKGFDKNNFNKQSLNESVFINQSFFFYIFISYTGF